MSMPQKLEQAQLPQIQQDAVMMGVQQPGFNDLPQGLYSSLVQTWFLLIIYYAVGMQWNPAMAGYAPHLMTGFMPMSAGIQNQVPMVQPDRSY
jgi:hypothetical protein